MSPYARVDIADRCARSWSSTTGGALPAGEIGNVARHLAALHRDQADVIAFRGQPPARQAALQRAGFLHRPLPRAVGVCIDRHNLLPTRDWYMVPADGDMAR